MRILLGDERVDPTAVENYAIRFAVDNSHLEVVKELLKWRGPGNLTVDPMVDNNYPIKATTNGHFEMVKILLETTVGGQEGGS